MRRLCRLLGQLANRSCYFPGCTWTGTTYAEWEAHLSSHY